MRNTAHAWKNLTVVKEQAFIDAPCKFLHDEEILTFDQILDVVEVARYSSFRAANLLFSYKILCDDRIRFQSSPIRSVLPCGQASVFPYMISIAINISSAAFPLTGGILMNNINVLTDSQHILVEQNIGLLSYALKKLPSHLFNIPEDTFQFGTIVLM